MSTAPWIVCESSSRWTAALRITISRAKDRANTSSSIFEVRSLTELTHQTAEHPNGLALIEITLANLDATLTWLADAIGNHDLSAAVALLDSSFFLHRSSRIDPYYEQRRLVAAVLREAGASDIVHSPRHLRGILTLAERHAAASKVLARRLSGANSSFEDWAWSLLPWQDARSPLG